MRGFRIVVILLMVLALMAATVGAVPPLPSSFWGILTMNGARLPLTAQLVAYVGDVPCGRAHLFLYQGTTYYSISAKGDDPDTPVKDGGVSGDLLQFRLDGVPLATTALWNGGTNEPLDMLETSPHRLAATERLSLPMIANEFWPQVLDTN